MRSMKKLLALALTLCLVLGMMVIPTSAAFAPVFSVENTTGEAGKTVEVNVNVSGNDATGLAAVSLRVYYKKDEVTCTKAVRTGVWQEYIVAVADAVDGNSASMALKAEDTQNLSTERANAGWSMASIGLMTDYKDVKFTANGAIAKLTFEVNSNLESGDVPLEIEVVEGKAENANNVKVDATATNGKIAVKGVAPTLGAVTLDKEGVGVNGTQGGTAKATATSTSNKNITNNVTWSVAPAGQGVTVAADGTVTVDPKATDDRYTITATPKAGETLGTPQTATLLVIRANSVVDKVEIASTPSTTIAKPVGEGAAAKEVTYTAKAYDQYDDEMTTATITWATEGTVPEGVTVDGAKVSVPATAETGSFTLKATSGSAIATITVKVVDIEFTVGAGAITASGTYGQKWSEIVKIDASKITAKVGPDTVTGDYTVVNADKAPDSGEQEYNVVFNNATYKNIPVGTYKTTVAKAKATVTMDDQTRAYGSANPELTWKATGLVNGEAAGVLTVTPACAATPTTAVGEVAITATATADNYDVTVVPGKLTITPVKVTAITGAETALNLSKAEVLAAADLKALGLAEKVTLAFEGEDVADLEVAATYDKTLENIKSVANSVTDARDGTVEVALTNACFPAYADKAGSTVTLPKTTITITNKYPIPATDITVEEKTVTYGETYEDPTASVDATAHPEYADMKFAYTYADKDGRPVSGKPVNAGEYTVTVTAENDNYKGKQTAKLTISPKPLADSMVTLPENATYTYNKKAHTPAPTVKDGETTLRLTTDYTVGYTNNVNAGTATVTVTGKGNYGGTASATFEIAKASLAEMKPTLVGNGQIGTVLTASLSGVDNEELVWTLICNGEENEEQFPGLFSMEVTPLDSNLAYAVKATAAEDGNYTGTTQVSAAVTVAKFTVAGTLTVTETGGEAGKIEVGDVLTAVPSLNLDLDAEWYTFQWYNDGQAIDGATEATYTVAEGDTKLSVTLTPHEDFNGTVSSAVLEVGKSVLTGTVTVTPGAEAVAVGTELTVAVDTAAAEADYDITWLRDGVAIPGATGTTYTVTENDLGKTITVKVTAKGDSYSGELVSAPVAVPAGAPDAPKASAAAGNGSVTVNWNEPATHGAPILCYIVGAFKDLDQVDENGIPTNVVATVQVDATTRRYTFEGLENDVEYGFLVAAVASDDLESVSELVKATPKEPTYSGGGGGGSTANTKTETLADGTKVTTTELSGGVSKETITRPNGTKADMTYNKDGSANGTVTMKDGAKATVTTTKDGETTAKVTVPAKVDASNVTIPAKNVKPGTVAVIVKDDGTEEIVRMSTVDEVGVVVKLADSATVKLVNNAKSFEDVPGHWAEANVDFVSAHELFNGTDATHFTPNGTMTRGMVATVLFRLDGETKGDVTASFADVAAGTWYTDAVAWANAQGVVTGYSDTAFGPDDNVTREQLAVMLYRYAKTLKLVKDAKTELNFVDADSVNDWAADAVSWLTANGILIGKPGNVLDPQGNATRAEVSAVLERFVEFAVK